MCSSDLTVKSGETLASIANRYKITRANLADANGLKATAKLQPGQSLLVPGAAAAAVTSVPSKPATAPKPAAPATGTAKTDAAKPKAPAATPGTPVTYKVKSGDTLSGIAKQFSVTVDQIKRWNNLSGNALSVGKQLKIYR